jgi:hypothetical protein
MLRTIKKYGFHAVLFLVLCSYAFPAGSEEQPVNSQQHVQDCINRAHAMKLSADPYWLLLLHYKRGVMGKRSLIDDPSFFLAPNGKWDPRAEMEADIRAFFQPIVEGRLHPGYKFIARFEWLREKLQFDTTLLPEDFPARFNDLMKNLDPASVLFVFPAGYIDSPASMFGHTLIVLERSDKNRLTSLTINYAAKTTDTFGPAFAFKGVFGLYSGFYSFLPYYQKINEYSNSEMRDMWEYRLNLNADEIKRLVMHMVEMENTGARYFFFDENCSYNILYLLEAARPSTGLTSRFTTTVEPIDTIREVKKKGLVSGTEYRPSLYSKIMYRASRMNTEDQKTAIRISKGEIAAAQALKEVPVNRAVCILDQSTDYLMLLAAKTKIPQEDYNRRFLSILRQRNTISQPVDTLEGMERPAPPESSHPSNKASLSYGFQSMKHYIQIGYHPSCHEIMDVDRGLTRNSEIVFGGVSARYYPESSLFRIERLDILDIISLPRSTRYYVHGCWKLKFGAEQVPIPAGGEALSGYIDGGGGLSTGMGALGQIYSLMDIGFNFTDATKYNTLNTFGARLGILTDFGYLWKSHIYGRFGYVPWGDTTLLWEIGTRQRLMVTINAAVILGYRRYAVFDTITDEFTAGFNAYF